MLTEAADYATLYRDFRWDIPERFNIATVACDRHAGGSGKLALIYVDEDGAASRFTFDQMQSFSRRFANVLIADGLTRGDRHRHRRQLSGGDQRHGQGDRGAEGQVFRSDGLRQGQRLGQGGADGVRKSQGGFARSA